MKKRKPYRPRYQGRNAHEFWARVEKIERKSRDYGWIMRQLGYGLMEHEERVLKVLQGIEETPKK